MTAARIHDLLAETVGAAPDTIAFTDQQDRCVTWREVSDLAEDTAEALRRRQVGSGDRVVMAFENGIHFVAALFAVSRLNAVAVPFNARLSEAELKRVIAHCEPRALWFGTRDCVEAQRHCARFGAEPCLTGALAGPVRAETPDSSDMAPDVAVLLYTSGTSGRPKAAMISHENLLAASTASAMLRKLDKDDVFYIVAPMSHVLGLVAMLAVCRRGARAVLDARFSTERLVDLLGDGVTVFSGPPQMHTQLINHCNRNGVTRLAAPALRVVASGGAPLDPAWKTTAEAFYGLPLQNGYGLTESTAGVCSTDSAFGDPDTSVGFAMTESQIRLDFDRAGADPNAGVGEILVRGPQVMLGYFRNPEATSETIIDGGWLRTGDLGMFDGAGRLHIVGRIKELIIRSGFNVYPDEVQATLTSHPRILAAAVFGRQVRGNEEIVAAVQLAPDADLTAAAIQAHLKDLMAPYKRPNHILMLEDMPKTASGKVDKQALKILAENRLPR